MAMASRANETQRSCFAGVSPPVEMCRCNDLPFLAARRVKSNEGKTSSKEALAADWRNRFPVLSFSKAMRRERRPTIISPAGHIRSYAVRPFLALILAGCVLAFVAGFVNTICMIGFFQSPISAATGGTSRMVNAFAGGSFRTALHLLLTIISLVLGSLVSGALVGGSSFRVQRSYGLALLLESLILTVGYLISKSELQIKGVLVSLSLSAYLIAFACGLQNGLCTTFSGAVIRTTHVTGILTDIGLIIGQAAFHARTRKHLWKLKILVPLYLTFCAGGGIGWYSFQLLNNEAIFIPCAILGLLGLGHIFYWKILPRCRKETISRTDSVESVKFTHQSSEMPQGAEDSDDEEELPPTIGKVLNETESSPH